MDPLEIWTSDAFHCSAFSGVPKTDLLVHNPWGLVHVVNEDDLMLRDRPTSANFKQYSGISSEKILSCFQCLRSFQNRKLALFRFRGENRAQVNQSE